jgi:diaminopimelate decarboxylase
VSAPLTTFGVQRATPESELFMEGVSLASIAERFGTPCFVYSKAALTTAFQRLNAALAAARNGRPYLICYAVKANSNLAVLRLFAELGAGFDIVSGGELQRVLLAGGDPRKVVFSGLGKTAVEMAMALTADIKCFNVESEAELDRLQTVAASLGQRARISLRVNPDVDAKTHPYISTGLKNNKFGIAFDRALTVYRYAATLANIDIVGVDCHIGSQLTDDAPLQEAMARIVWLSDALAKEGIKVHHICPGGGIGITYRDEKTIDLDGYAAALEESLAGRGVELLLEPGRVLVGNAGVLLSRVEFVKLTEAKNFLIIDAAMNDLIRPSLYQAYHEVVVTHGARVGDVSATYDVVGPVCESADVLAHERELAAQEGDLLALLSAGAYAFVMSSNYNTRTRAAEVMVDGDGVRLIRRRETLDDLVGAELLDRVAQNDKSKND